MDLLLTPHDPAFPTDDVPFFTDDEPWTGGIFAHYASRRHLSTLVELDAISPEALQGFLQTWLFFGLLAESLGLNEQEGGHRAIDETSAKYEIGSLYNEYIFEKNGNKFISGAKVLTSGPLIRERFRQVANTVTGGAQARLRYMNQCFELAHQKIFSLGSKTEVDFRVKYSLAALGEIFATALFAVVHRLELPENVPTKARSFTQTWSYDYLAEGGAVERQMLDHGWCPSEIEKIRTEFMGLHTIHYASRVKKVGPKRDHSGCHKFQCLAFQIRLEEYQPTHTDNKCECQLLNVDMDGVMDILEHTETYPVLKGEISWCEARQRKEVQVEAFKEGIPYVAISHVWADGLGNPTTNSLPSCQIRRVTHLVAELQRQVDPGWEKEGRPAYRVWIDPLCCPVASEGKKISLQRIADVYRQSTHTLVLDASLTSMQADGAHPAELLFRLFGLSAWMRRLWTFQEGVLPQSLYYQFADRAMTADEMLFKVQVAGASDIRYLRLWTDHLRTIGPFIMLSRRKMLPGGLAGPVAPKENGRYDLMMLQIALNSRSVSVPKDEPLCIATLLSLDIARVVSEEDGQKRMAAVWEMLAKRLNGLPPNVIFYVDYPLEVEGFRWAPRSLLAGDVESNPDNDTNNPYAERRFLDSTLHLSHRSARFVWDEDEEMAQLIHEGNNQKGLRGRYAGYRVYVRPSESLSAYAAKGQRPYPWRSTSSSTTENRFFLKEKNTGKWFCLLEHQAGAKIDSRKKKEITKWQGEVVHPKLDKIIHSNHCALIVRNNLPTRKLSIPRPMPLACLMVLVEDENERELVVRRQTNVVLVEATEEENHVMETIVSLASKFAGEDNITTEFLAQNNRSEKYYDAAAEGKVKERMQQLVAEAWEERPDFAAAAQRFPFKDIRENGWMLIADWFSHHVVLEKTMDDQTWLID